MRGTRFEALVWFAGLTAVLVCVQSVGLENLGVVQAILSAENSYAAREWSVKTNPSVAGHLAWGFVVNVFALFAGTQVTLKLAKSIRQKRLALSLSNTGLIFILHAIVILPGAKGNFIPLYIGFVAGLLYSLRGFWETLLGLYGLVLLGFAIVTTWDAFAGRSALVPAEAGAVQEISVVAHQTQVLAVPVLERAFSVPVAVALQNLRFGVEERSLSWEILPFSFFLWNRLSIFLRRLRAFINPTSSMQPHSPRLQQILFFSLPLISDCPH